MWTFFGGRKGATFGLLQTLFNFVPENQSESSLVF
jgi:hypothetical protein